MRYGLAAAALAMVLPAGCERMMDQPRYDPLEYSEFFNDGLSARPIPAGTVPRGDPRTDDHLYFGRVNEALATEFPFPMTRADLERGRERFNIFCALCHGLTGEGDGMIVQRGFTPPPSFHLPRLRQAPVGHFFDVITNGWGAMYSYAERIAPEDRWRIAAYIQALQLSQHVPAAELPERDAGRLREVAQ
ncbi:MAG: hypothetical protein AMXMBFR13_13730 [Phycisphaerae bacterium]